LDLSGEYHFEKGTGHHMNLLRRNIFIIILFFFTTSAGRDLVLLGFDGQRAPSAEKTYDRILREHLSVTPGLQLFDQTQSLRFKQFINFDTHSVLSKDLIESLGKYVKDTTYIAWGTVGEFKVSPRRKFFFNAQIKGELSIELNIYSFLEHTLSYSGTIKATVFENKGVIFFSPISRAVHISALEQTELLEKVEYEVVRKTCQIISATVGSEISRSGKNSDEEKANDKAIKEVLTTPSVEAADVEKKAVNPDTAVGKPTADTTAANGIEKPSAGKQ
jgi:hypothetical protein